MTTNFKMIDLFAGIGGFRIAFERHKVRCVYSSEINAYSRKMYKNYFGKEPENSNIYNLESDEIPNFDILVGGFPCQPFSTVSFSKMKMNGFKDKRGTLFFEIARILNARQPLAFVLENVKNLLRHDNGRTWKIIHSTLLDLGYHVHFKVLNARHFDIPQHRERIFIVGFRENLPFSFPIPIELTHFVEDLRETDPDPKYNLSDLMSSRLEEAYKRDKPKSNHQKMYDWYNKIWKLKGIAKTIRTNEGCSTAGTLLYPQKRRLTPRECFRLQGFPEDYKIVVSGTQAYKQAGNAVAVPVVETIVPRVLEALSHAN